MAEISDLLNGIVSEPRSSAKKRVAKYLIQNSYDYDDIAAIDEDEVFNIIVKLKPPSYNYTVQLAIAIATIVCDVTGITLNVNNKKIWDRIYEENLQKKTLLSSKDINNLLKRIEMEYGENGLLNMVLIQSVYEGIYCSDLSVFYYLDAEDVDIDNNRVLLKPTGCKAYYVTVSEQLCKRLVDLSRQNVFIKHSKSRSVCEVEYFGRSTNSVFKKPYLNETAYSKAMQEKNEEEKLLAFKRYYHNQFGAIFKKCLGYKLKVFYLYMSGIFYRVMSDLESAGIPYNKSLFDTIDINSAAYRYIDKELCALRSGINARMFLINIAGKTDQMID